MIYAYIGDNLFNSVLPTPQQCLGPLPDTISCEMERDTEGLFDLTLAYPLKGTNAKYLEPGNWLYVPAGGNLGMQFFCIIQTETTVDKTITLHAVHISYNSNDITAAPFRVPADNEYTDTIAYWPWYQALKQAVDTVDFTQLGDFTVLGYTDELTVNAARYTEPVTLRQAVADAAADRGLFILSSGINLKLWKAPENTAPSFRIRYGQNLLTYSNTQDFDLYTYIFPYAFSKENTFNTYNGKIFRLNGVPQKYAGVTKIRAVNLTGLYGLDILDDVPLDIFKDVIALWLKDHPFSFLPREISLEAVPGDGNVYELGYTGEIYGPDNTPVKATIVSLRYDVLRDKVTDIGIDKVRQDISDTIASLKRKER